MPTMAATVFKRTLPRVKPPAAPPVGEALAPVLDAGTRAVEEPVVFGGADVDGPLRAALVQGRQSVTRKSTLKGSVCTKPCECNSPAGSTTGCRSSTASYSTGV